LLRLVGPRLPRLDLLGVERSRGRRHGVRKWIVVDPGDDVTCFHGEFGGRKRGSIHRDRVGLLSPGFSRGRMGCEVRRRQLRHVPNERHQAPDLLVGMVRSKRGHPPRALADDRRNLLARPSLADVQQPNNADTFCSASSHSACLTNSSSDERPSATTASTGRPRIPPRELSSEIARSVASMTGLSVHAIIPV